MKIETIDFRWFADDLHLLDKAKKKKVFCSYSLNEIYNTKVSIYKEVERI